MIVYHSGLSPEHEEFISLRKPREFYQALGGAEGELRIAMRAERGDLELAHHPEHVAAVFEGRSANGFGSTSMKLLDQVKRANGAMISAVAWAILSRKGVCAPVSGFHHAGYDYCGGFCTFNGLLVAERAARRARLLRSEDRVLIYDGDAHFGDGCVDIIEKLDLQGQVEYLGRNYGIDDVHPLQQLRELAKNFRQYALILYQAGMDAYTEDPFRSGYLTRQELEERDRLVFAGCRDAGVPLAWNLAGGYHETATLSLHLQTWHAFKAIYERAPIPHVT